MTEWITGISFVALVGICLKIAMSKVNRNECDSRIKLVDTKIQHIKERVDEIHKDTKEILRRNGG